jgi:exodeoxyribonuclease V alpha subunit
MRTIEQTLERLKASNFRAKFHLSEKDKAYVKEKGMELLRAHCADIVQKRLTPAIIANDGKQTPMRGHPVFVAQHACACCCRSCLNKWYNVKIGVELSNDQQEKIVNLLMAWIEAEMES